MRTNEKHEKMRQIEIWVLSYFNLARFVEIWALAPGNPSPLNLEGAREKMRKHETK